MSETQMVFKYSRKKVLNNVLFLWVLCGANILALCLKLYSYFRFARPFQSYDFVYFAYLLQTIWSIWWVITLCGRHIEVTDNEVKMVNRSGRLVKSARFDEISELRFGSFISEPRNHWIVGVDGKKWLLSGYCENFQALAQLVEERTGKVFTEHATARKMKQAS